MLCHLCLANPAKEKCQNDKAGKASTKPEQCRNSSCWQNAWRSLLELEPTGRLKPGQGKHGSHQQHLAWSGPGSLSHRFGDLFGVCFQSDYYSESHMLALLTPLETIPQLPCWVVNSVSEPTLLTAKHWNFHLCPLYFILFQLDMHWFEIKPFSRRFNQKHQALQRVSMAWWWDGMLWEKTISVIYKELRWVL